MLAEGDDVCETAVDPASPCLDRLAPVMFRPATPLRRALTTAIRSADRIKGFGAGWAPLGDPPHEPPPVSPARGPPPDCGAFVQADDDWAIFQAPPDELSVLDIHLL